MNIFGVGLPEIAVIAGLALVSFGPKRLPELGRTLGKTLKGLQKASTEFESEIQKKRYPNSVPSFIHYILKSFIHITNIITSKNKTHMISFIL